MQPRKKYYLLIIIVVVACCLSFTGTVLPREQVAKYYDRQLDTVMQQLQLLQHAAMQHSGKPVLIQDYKSCRIAYKKVEFLIDVFTPYKARQLNGPDLLKIEEENPRDSLKPHGLQVIESILYTESIDGQKLIAETGLLLKNIAQLRNDPDRTYYFKDDKIWEAMRLGTYRIISLGITGFDVPLSYHALPETKAALGGMQKVAALYKTSGNAALYHTGDSLYSRAAFYLSQHRDFNIFDRLTFIREYINPVSAWLSNAAIAGGWVNYAQRSPLNPVAKDLFAADIMDLSFFSPNDKYKLTPDRIALGKRLFYDKQLSGNGERSCASCHQPQLAFTDGLRRPTDVSGNKALLRNTPTLWNTALQTKQFYDSRTEKLENQLSAVVHNSDEMNGSLRSSIGKLTADKAYAGLFATAYPGQAAHITEYNIANAISCYVRTLISLSSRFDSYMRHETDNMSRSEKNGFNLFMGKAKCGTCHYAPIFNGLTPPLYQESESETLAVPATDGAAAALDSDAGKYLFTRVPFHKYSFKTPTIRNSALTAPYMHNGVFKTLDDVVQFYNDGGGAGRGINLATQSLPAEKLHLTKSELTDIVAFLHTLTDTSGTSINSYKIN